MLTFSKTPDSQPLRKASTLRSKPTLLTDSLSVGEPPVKPGVEPLRNLRLGDTPGAETTDGKATALPVRSAPRKQAKPASRGRLVVIGLDTEYQGTDGSNDVISYQIAGFDPGRGVSWKAIHYCDPGERLTLSQVIQLALREGRAQGCCKPWPTEVVSVAHFGLAEMSCFRDFDEIKDDFDALRRTYVTLSKPLKITLTDKNRNQFDVSVVHRDTMLLAPAGAQSLSAIGKIVRLEKIELRPGEIEKMRELREREPARFEEYALRDAEICCRYLLRVADICRGLAGRESCRYEKDDFPVTLSSIGVNHLLGLWSKTGISHLNVIGQEEVKLRKSHGGLGWSIRPNQHRSDTETLATECFSGGRNEQFSHGPSEIGEWSDVDLRGAYTTALAMVGSPDWGGLTRTKSMDDLCSCRYLGFARVRFAFPSGTRFPSLPVRTNYGLIFPRTGITSVCSPELSLARSMGAELEVEDGFILPVIPSTKPFQLYVADCQARRKSAKAPDGSKSLEELFWKELANATYGKLAQGLMRHRVFDSRDGLHHDLPPSRITCPHIAAWVTSMVRSVVSEMLHRLPATVLVSNVTTDGILCTATEAQMAHATSGPLCGAFAAARLDLAGTNAITEIKHKVRQVLGWKTRGQATLLKCDGYAPVLAKAGLSLPKSIPDQNSEIVRLFLNRDYESKLVNRRLRTLPQLWHSGGDLVGFEQETRINMDYDFKRKPLNPEARIVDGVAVVFYETTAWESAAQFAEWRESHDRWRKSQRRCMKTLDDYSSFLGWMAFGSHRKRIYSKKCAAKSAVKLLVRAMEKERWGLSRQGKTIGKSRNIWTIWFQQLGYKVTVRDFENAARPGAILEENVIPPDNDVLKLLDAIAEQFPSFERDRILIRNAAS